METNTSEICKLIGSLSLDYTDQLQDIINDGHDREDGDLGMGN